MTTQPILLVIGIAIAVNLVIMGGLVVALVARRRGRLATPDGIIEPAPYRYSAMSLNPPTATSSISFIDADSDDDDDEYERTNEDDDEDVSATEPADFRRFRPVQSDEGERVESTIESFLSGGSTNAVPPVAEIDQERVAPAPAPVVAPPPAPAPTVAPAPGPVAAPRQSAFAAPRMPSATSDDKLEWEVRLRDEEARLSRYRRPVSVVLVELDGIERLIHRLGPDAAERIVPPVGQTLARQARTADHVARIGPGRFAVLLPETDEIQAINYVERVRTECDRWLAAGAVSMRLAIGWASPTPGGDLRTATRIAEDRLNADRRRSVARAEFSETAWDAELTVELTPPAGAE
jgi:diguanylate cyclase (GGDEF)-like protein